VADEQDSSQERSEEPTAKRLQDSRNKGQVARSRELNTAVVLLASFVVVSLLGSWMADQLQQIIHTDLKLSRDILLDDATPLRQLRVSVMSALQLLLPAFLALVIASFIGPLIAGGWSFSLGPLKPSPSKLSPLKGFKRMFGMQGLAELLKSLAKFLLLAGISILLYQQLKYSYFNLGRLPMQHAIAQAMDLIVLVFLGLTAGLILMAIIDLPYQRWEHKRKQRMTRQELKEESKETNGNPETKAKIRRLQEEAANRKMLVDVKTTDVIIVNPTHYSVALKYEKSGDGAPIVVARGIDHMALRIREIGRAHGVEVYSAPLLARVLYHKVRVGQEVPVDLYLAVAQILAYVYQLDRHQRGEGAEPVRPDSLPIPAEYNGH